MELNELKELVKTEASRCKARPNGSRSPFTFHRHTVDALRCGPLSKNSTSQIRPRIHLEYHTAAKGLWFTKGC